MEKEKKRGKQIEKKSINKQTKSTKTHLKSKTTESKTLFTIPRPSSLTPKLRGDQYQNIDTRTEFIGGSVANNKTLPL